jgi:uncharacterized low-complexity protein
MVKKSKSILWTAVAAGAMLTTASLFASCSTESKEVGTETHAPADSSAEHKCGADSKCGAHKDSMKAEGKCGEAKCGDSLKTTEAKCGEGKCGTDKKK